MMGRVFRESDVPLFGERQQDASLLFNETDPGMEDGRWSDLPATAQKDDMQKGEFRITVPVVVPAGWQELQPILDGKAVAFDERGVKETMLVKSSRWGNFVDRQKARLEKEIQAARLARQRCLARQGSQNLDSEDGSRTFALAEVEEHNELSDVYGEDIGELEQMVDRMEDWKDLSRYAGKSIGMASTRRGNEMQIHVMAFAEREDSTGVDFMRLSYKKSVEVCANETPPIGTPIGNKVRHAILPWIAHVAEDQDEQWVRLLQRPDMAKFTIALAFRKALESDGIHLKFCEAGLSDT
jgi:hypothetical protein